MDEYYNPRPDADSSTAEVVRAPAPPRHPVSALRRLVPGVLLAAACARGPAPPGPWHEEAGYRWRDLAGHGRATDGFTRLDAAKTGIAFSNTVSDSAAYRNRHLMDGSGVAI